MDRINSVQISKRETKVRKQIRTPARTAVAICLYRITEQVRSCNLTKNHRERYQAMRSILLRSGYLENCVQVTKLSADRYQCNFTAANDLTLIYPN